MFGLQLGRLGISGSLWSERALWPQGASSPGLWIDPSYSASQWQDSAGTTALSTVGTVLDSSNPVGLILDRKGGATLKTDAGLHLSQSTSAARPVASARVNLLTYTETLGTPNWVFTRSSASTVATSPDSRFAASALVVPTAVAGTHGCSTSVSVRGASNTIRVRIKPSGYERFLLEDGQYGSFWFSVSTAGAGTVLTQNNCTVSINTDVGGWYLVTATVPNLINTGAFAFCVFPEALSPAQFGGPSFTGDGTSGMRITGFELVPTSAANLPYQRVNTASDYTATGFPQYLKFDGVDDALSSATFAAGTIPGLTDCLIAVRRDSTANAVCGLYNAVADATKFFGMAESGSGSGCVGSGAGTPTVWVDGVQLTGGTAVTRGTLHTALTAGAWHILEFRGLDLSTWTAAGFGVYTSYVLNGALGGIELFAASSASDRDKARTKLATKVGLML